MPIGWRMPTAPAPAKLLGNAKSTADLGQSFGATLTETRGQVPDVDRMGRALPKTSYGDDPSSGCGCRPTKSPRSTSGSRPTALPVNVPCLKREGGHERHARTCHANSRWRRDHSRCLADARSRHAERAARADAVGQDLDHAAARRSRQADDRPRAGRRQGRHRRRRAAALGRDGLSAVHQLSLADGLREHRLAAARAGQAARGNRQARPGGGKPCCGSSRI